MHKQLKNQKIPSFYWDIQYSVLSLPCVVTYGFFTFFTYFSCFSTLFEHVFNAYGTSPWQFFAVESNLCPDNIDEVLVSSFAGLPNMLSTAFFVEKFLIIWGFFDRSSIEGMHNSSLSWRKKYRSSFFYHFVIFVI